MTAPKQKATSRSKPKAAKKKAAKRAPRKAAKKKAKPRSKKGFKPGHVTNWRGHRVEVLFFTNTELVSALQGVMSLEEDYVRRSNTIRWYCTEDQIRLKWKRLERVIKQHPKKKTLLQPLLDYIKDQIEARMELFQRNMADGFVTFDDLWLLFYEDQEIVYDDEGALMAGKIQKSTLYRGWSGLQYGMTIKVIAHDGEKFTEVDKTVTVPYFTDGELLNNLPVRPLSDHTKKHLAERGKRVVETIQAGSSYVYYRGECISRQWWGTKRYRADGRCMLDPKTHKKMNEDYERRFADYYPDEPETKSSSEESMNEVGVRDLWRVSPWIPGFSFAAKQWGEFCIENVTPISFNTDAYDQLVLPERIIEGQEVHPKRMIRSLIEHGAVGFTDVIADKGGGIIFLLHGPPGTGKTLTAEAIADLLKRPLYSVSVGELGTATLDLEKNLRTVLEVATLWNAVLLIDEADIFLEKRTPRDIERNALVAIFLRMLEYYQGVLFLTTNRVKQFDPAFNSRLSIALHYPEHTVANRMQIWSNLLNAAGIDPKKFSVKKLAQHDVNGRQIKHAIRIGLSLAANESREVVVEDFLKTLVLAKHFNEQLSANPDAHDLPGMPRDPDDVPVVTITDKGKSNGRRTVGHR